MTLLPLLQTADPTTEEAWSLVFVLLASTLGALLSRLHGTIVLPMQDVKLSCEELERMAKHPCMRAVFIAEHINGKNLHEKEFWPVYERAEALGLPLFLQGEE